MVDVHAHQRNRDRLAADMAERFFADLSGRDRWTGQFLNWLHDADPDYRLKVARQVGRDRMPSDETWHRFILAVAQRCAGWRAGRGDPFCARVKAEGVPPDDVYWVCERPKGHLETTCTGRGYDRRGREVGGGTLEWYTERSDTTAGQFQRRPDLLEQAERHRTAGLAKPDGEPV